MSKELEVLENTNIAVNVIDIASKIVLSIAGNDIANTLGGEQITPSGLRQAIAARVQMNLKNKGC